MSCYVSFPGDKRCPEWRGRISAYLFADTSREMFDMAEKLHIPFSRLCVRQLHFPHFHLIGHKHHEAERFGAKRLEGYEVMEHIRQRRAEFFAKIKEEP